MKPLTVIGAAVLTLSASIGPSLAAEPAANCIGDPVKQGWYALVIGNSYGGSDTVSGVQDAKDMSCSLQQLGFTLAGDRALTDLDITAIRTALDDFTTKMLPQAKVALFYFSGHGFHKQDKNYLVPVNYSLEETALLEVGEVLRRFGAVIDKHAVKIVLLDACRSSTEIRRRQQQHEAGDWAAGASTIESPAQSGILIGFATLYDHPARSASSNERNSSYTAALLNHLTEPGLKLRQLLNVVLLEVAKAPGGQIPWDEGAANIPEDFCLRPAVELIATISCADDDLIVLVNDRVALSFGEQGTLPVSVPLVAGDNRVEVRAYNQKTYRNTHSWESPEGWNYHLTLKRKDGTIVLDLLDGEPVVFKDGPHHGKWFKVAQATINVHQQRAFVTLSSQDKDLWKQPSPPWTSYQSDQAILAKIPLPRPDLGFFNGLLDQLIGTQEIDFLIGGRRDLAGKAQACTDALSHDQARLQAMFSDYLLALVGSGTPATAEEAFKPISACVGAPIWYAVEPAADTAPNPPCGSAAVSSFRCLDVNSHRESSQLGIAAEDDESDRDLAHHDVLCCPAWLHATAGRGGLGAGR